MLQHWYIVSSNFVWTINRHGMCTDFHRRRSRDECEKYFDYCSIRMFDSMFEFWIYAKMFACFHPLRIEAIRIFICLGIWVWLLCENKKGKIFSFQCSMLFSCLISLSFIQSKWNSIFIFELTQKSKQREYFYKALNISVNLWQSFLWFSKKKCEKYANDILLFDFFVGFSTKTMHIYSPIVI